MQRFSDELTRLKFKRQKVKRMLDKIYNTKYEELKMGRLNVKLNSKTEYDIYIAKGSKYQRVKSYHEILDILIEHIDRTIKNLSQKIFVIQSMVKDRDRDMGQY
jgi:hypothetical protein